jgi:hypothetical protein
MSKTLFEAGVKLPWITFFLFLIRLQKGFFSFEYTINY